MKATDYFDGVKEKKCIKEQNRKLLIISVITLMLSPILFFLSLCLGDKYPVFLVFIPVSPLAFIIAIIVLCLNNSKYIETVSYLTDEAYDSLVELGIKNNSSDPKEYLALDDSEVMEIEPIELCGYEFSGACKVKFGKDGKFRSNIYEKATIFFTKNEVHMYKATYDSIVDRVNESTEVLFYPDVVSVSTTSETKKAGDISVNYLSFNLMSKGGKAFSVALQGADGDQRSINAMRALIKEKKQG